MALTVLHQDAWLLAVVKPAGMLTHNSAFAGPREISLMDALADQVGGPLHLVHRLDRGASGVVLVARDPDTARDLQSRWAAEETAKTYRALVRGHLLTAVDVDHPVPDELGVRREARSRVEPVESSCVDRCSVVDVRIFTGRHHQVRRHLKHLSHPILGDSNHGKGPLNRQFKEQYGLGRLGLHALSLTVRHPRTDAVLWLVAPLPEELAAVLRKLFRGAAWEIPRVPPLANPFSRA